MAVKAIVGDEKFSTGGDRVLVALVGIFYRNRLD